MIRSLEIIAFTIRSGPGTLASTVMAPRIEDIAPASARTLSSFVKFYNTKKSGEDERQFLKLYPFTNPLMYCVCDSRGYNTAPAASLEGDLYLRKCVFQACPRFTVLNDARGKEWAECAQIADWKFTATISTRWRA